MRDVVWRRDDDMSGRGASTERWRDGKELKRGGRSFYIDV